MSAVKFPKENSYQLLGSLHSPSPGLVCHRQMGSQLGLLGLIKPHAVLFGPTKTLTKMQIQLPAATKTKLMILVLVKIKGVYSGATTWETDDCHLKAYPLLTQAHGVGAFKMYLILFLAFLILSPIIYLSSSWHAQSLSTHFPSFGTLSVRPIFYNVGDFLVHPVYDTNVAEQLLG